MKKTLWIAAVAAAALTFVAQQAPAQSDVLLQLRSGSPAGDRVRVDSAGGFVAMGQLGIGLIPASGCGYRMMWYPYRGAFRAGTTDDGGACNYWDDANIGFYSWAGGNLTKASAFASFAFGDQVTVSGTDAVGFGGSSTVSGTAGFSVGAGNNCTGYACVTMGYSNTASGQGSVAIGYRVTADANYSVALGHRASANGRTGSFVWADASTTDSLESFANNSFRIRAAGGVALYTNSTTSTGVYLNAGGSAWNVLSDRNRKELFLPVDGEDILTRIRSTPVSSWRYKSEADETVRHIGPMAQDWYRAFGLSSDSMSINSGDFDGINLAAIQALEERTAELARVKADKAETEERLARLEAENAALREEQRALARRLERLEAASDH